MHRTTFERNSSTCKLKDLFLRAIINSCEVIKFVNDVLSNAFKHLQLIACLCTSLIKEKKQVCHQYYFGNWKPKKQDSFLRCDVI